MRTSGESRRRNFWPEAECPAKFIIPGRNEPCHDGSSSSLLCFFLVYSYAYYFFVLFLLSINLLLMPNRQA